MMTWVKNYLEAFAVELKTISTCLQEMEKDLKKLKEEFKGLRKDLKTLGDSSHERNI